MIDSIARVAMNGKTLNRVMTIPFTSPTAAPVNSASIVPAAIPYRRMPKAAITLTSATVEPTDRSRPAGEDREGLAERNRRKRRRRDADVAEVLDRRKHRGQHREQHHKGDDGQRQADVSRVVTQEAA